MTTGNGDAAEQVIELREGWNAVYLELDPLEPEPEKVFAGKPVEMCALWLPSEAKVESLTAPDAIPRKASDWLVWQPESSPSAFLNNLHSLKARLSMLVKASEPTTITIAGHHSYQRMKWTAPSFNFVGFDVDPDASPTFARFFDGSRAHADLKIFELVDSKWQPVVAQQTVQRGKAYWVWCAEGSDFQGPLDVSVVVDRDGSIPVNRNGGSFRLETRLPGTIPANLNLKATGLPLRFEDAEPEGGDSGATGETYSHWIEHGDRTRIQASSISGRAASTAGGVLEITGAGMKRMIRMVSVPTTD